MNIESGYIRILCLITEHFSFEIQDLDNFENVITEKMALTAQDSLSAKALKQVRNLHRPATAGAGATAGATAGAGVTKVGQEENVDLKKMEEEKEKAM